MIRIRIGLLVVALGLAFMFSGCGDGGNGGTGNSGETPPDDPPLSGDPALESIVEQLEQIPDHPSVIRLNAEPAVSSPGGTVNFNTPFTTLSGRLILASDGGTVETEFVDGQGSLSTSGLADGLYPVWVEEAGGGAVAVGSIRINSEPGIWLSADRRYVAPGETATLRVDTHDLPEASGLPILTSILHGALELPPEWEAIDLMSVHSRALAPDAEGSLVPGYRFRQPVASFTEQPLFLDGALSGSFHAAAVLDYDSFDAPDLSKGDAWLSSPVTIEQCDQKGILSGDAGGTGTIRILPLDSAGGVVYVDTQDGMFEVELPAGRALVLSPDGSDPVVVDVPCGTTAVLPATTLSTLSVSAAAAGPSTAGVAPGADACRTVYVDSIESTEADVPGELVTELLSTRLFSRLVRASVMDANTVKDLLDLLALQQLTGVPEDSQVNFPAINDAIGSDFLVHGRISRAGQSLVVTFVGLDLKRQRTAAAVQNIHTADGVAVYGAIDAAARQFAEEMVGAAVCATVEPAESELRPGASLALTVQAEDLAGNPLEAGDVSASEPVCGTLEPRSGALAEGTFETNYTAEQDATCKEAIEFDVTVSRDISTNPGEVIANIDLLPLWNFDLALDVPGENQLYQWNGTFTVEEGRISGSGSGSMESASECEVRVNGVLEGTYPYSVEGSFEFDLAGEQLQKDWGEEFRLQVLGYNTQINQQYPAECGENLFGDFLEVIMAYIAEYPQVLAQQSDPPSLPVPAVDQGEATYPLPDSDGGEFTVTVSTEAAP